MSRLIDADEFLVTNKVLADCEIEHPKYQETVRELINDAPTVEAEPVRHGHWIKDNDEYDKCSICGNLHHYSESYGYYCQHCGARMDEVETK